MQTDDITKVLVTKIPLRTTDELLVEDKSQHYCSLNGYQ